MSPQRWRDLNAPPADRVTAVEVFFDVVFVFTLTQLTRTLGEGLTFATVGRILLVFGALWYMYGGYAWLTNHVPPRRGIQKLFLFVAMVGFFVSAIGIPRAFDIGGVLFGGGYLVVICVHLLLFTQSDAVSGVKRLAPFNLGGALMILAAGFVDGPMKYALWIGGFFGMTVLPYLLPAYSWLAEARSFHVAAEHFVERHSVLVMIALGESVIAIGAGLDVAHVSPGVIAMVVLALALPSALWWTYFTDYSSAEHHLAAAENEARSLLALEAYYFGHIPILLGIVVAAAGLHSAVEHPSAVLDWPAATALAGGVSLFLSGIGYVRRRMEIDGAPSRFIGAGVALGSIPIGPFVNAGVHLAALVAIVVGMLVVSASSRSSSVRSHSV